MTSNKLVRGVLMSLVAIAAGALPPGGPANPPAFAWDEPSTPIVRYEQDDAAVAYSGSWYTSNQSAARSGGDAALSMEAGARAEFAFTGPEVRWIGTRDEWSGIARVFVDGVLQGTVDTFALPTQARTQEVLFAARDLPAASHTLTIEVTGSRNLLSLGSWIWIDAFDVLPRFEQDHPAVRYEGHWYEDASPAFSGGSAVLAMDPGERVVFTFRGTTARWIGVRDAWSGVARVRLDGSLVATVDTYAEDGATQAVLYATGILPAGVHTLEIEVDTQRNPASNGSWIWIDAFDLETGGADPAPPPPAEVTRVEETDAAVTWDGTWFESARPDHSGGTAQKSSVAGSRAGLAFSGTGVRWIGFKGPVTGVARVYLDGALVAEVDTASAAEEPQAVLFNAAGLPPGAHTLVIEVTGGFNPPSNAAWIAIDAFEVTS